MKLTVAAAGAHDGPERRAGRGRCWPRSASWPRRPGSTTASARSCCPATCPELKALLADAPDVGVGGVVGFPSGAHSTAIKVAEAREQLADGRDGTGHGDQRRHAPLRPRSATSRTTSARWSRRPAAVPVKVILEAHYLTDEQIVRGSQLAVRAGRGLRQDRHRLGADRRHAAQRAR